VHALTDLCSEWEVETFSLGWVSRSGAANKDVNKTWTKTFPCNQSAQSVMAAVQNNMGQFADNQGSFFASTFPSQPITMGGGNLSQPITMGGGNLGESGGIWGNLGTDGTFPSFESKMGNALMIPNQN
jgi:hypothetical protein